MSVLGLTPQARPKKSSLFCVGVGKRVYSIFRLLGKRGDPGALLPSRAGLYSCEH